MSEEPKSTNAVSFTGTKSQITQQVDVDVYMGLGPLTFAEARMDGEHPDGYRIEWLALVPSGFRLNITKDGKHVITGIVREQALIRSLTDALLAKLAEPEGTTTEGT